MLTAFLDTLDTSRLGLVVAAGLHPLAALDNCWAVQSCVTSMNPAHVYPDNLVLDLNEPEGTYRSTVARLFHNLGIGRSPDEVIWWFSGMADTRDGGGVLVIFEKQGEVADHTRMLLFANTIRHIQLSAQLGRQQEQYDGWLNEVRTIKENLLPPADHRLSGIDHAVFYRSCVGGGGDYYDLVDLRPALARASLKTPSPYIGVALCDVSGHGPGAAVEVAMLDAIVRTYRGKPQEGPADVLHYLNRHFFTRHLRGVFVTGVLCHYDARHNRLLWTNAGHLPVIVQRRDGRVEVLDDSQGIPVGIDRDSHWEVHETHLYPGDGILLMSDGITEALSTTNVQFGFDRVLTLLRDNAQHNARQMVDRVIQALDEHIQGSDDQDDQTLLFLRVLP